MRHLPNTTTYDVRRHTLRGRRPPITVNACLQPTHSSPRRVLLNALFSNDCDDLIFLLGLETVNPGTLNAKIGLSTRRSIHFSSGRVFPCECIVPRTSCRSSSLPSAHVAERFNGLVNNLHVREPVVDHHLIIVFGGRSLATRPPSDVVRTG